jgi:hypothetical protein
MKQKPIVSFTGEAEFFSVFIRDEDKEELNLDTNEVTVAGVHAINHPKLGSLKVRTSVVVKKNHDGSFETLNTIYVPHDLS